MKLPVASGKDVVKALSKNVRNEFNLVCTAHIMKVMLAKICRMGISLSEIVGLVSGQAAKVAAI